MPNLTSRPTKTAPSSFAFGNCNVDAVITAGVNGNGGGTRVARNTVINALFSIFDFTCSIRFLLRKRSRPFSPVLRINKSITNTPITDPIAEATTYAIHFGPSRFELTSAISNRSFPKGSTRNDESRALSSSRPNIPSLRKKRTNELETLIMTNRRGWSSKSKLPVTPDTYFSLVGSGACGSVIGGG